ncbi:hypothetical protein TanjilG_14221 [Lupinus angustifolius]|uniref:Uncharacterized protein n=1 Tax=Lupinus angustifolius TaxID=3871 RepID=A0A1J7GKV9_LUPAN|nr:hypothetical protein TanjilG_14221 [Lupinus angustifolius]
MQTYHILLCRNSKTTTVAVDHSTLGGGMNISLHRARRWFYGTDMSFCIRVIIGKNDGPMHDALIHLMGYEEDRGKQPYHPDKRIGCFWDLAGSDEVRMNHHSLQYNSVTLQP